MTGILFGSFFIGEHFDQQMIYANSAGQIIKISSLL